MYASIVELPPQVRNSLDEDDQKVFLEAYNGLSPQNDSEAREARRRAWEACKERPSSFSFNIVASVDAIDKSKEIIDIPTLKECMDDYIDRGGNVQLDHGNYTVGTIWDWNPVEVDGMEGVEVWGNLFGGEKVFDATRRQFVNGMNSLSVAGESGPGRYMCDDKGCYVRRDVKQLMEISVCRNPSNRYATMKWYNEDAKNFKKSGDAGDVNLRIRSYTVHRDYTTCPILGLAKSLRDCGVECHAAKDGVEVAMTYQAFVKSAMDMARSGLWAEWSGGRALLRTKETVMEEAFKRGYRNGWVEKEGYLTEDAPKEYFVELWRKGLVDGGGRLWPDAELRG